jgi:hypothetical protein
MSYALLGIVLALFGVMLHAAYEDVDAQIVGSPIVETGQSAAASFLLYRNAVLSLLEANPSVPVASSAIPLTSLTFPSGISASAIPGNVSNFVVVDGGGERTVYVFEPPIGGMAQGLDGVTAGDQTIGTDNGGIFVTLSGLSLDPVPADVPVSSGDVLSVVQLGG